MDEVPYKLMEIAYNDAKLCLIKPTAYSLERGGATYMHGYVLTI